MKAKCIEGLRMIAVKIIHSHLTFFVMRIRVLLSFWSTTMRFDLLIPVLVHV